MTERHLFPWLGPLAGFVELGTAGYSRPVRRRLKIVNAMALLIAVFSAIYAGIFAYHGAAYMPLIVANLLLMAVALLAPLAHRINDIAAALLLAAAEFIALFFFVRELGHDSGIQLNYIIVAAVAFAIYGMTRFRLVVAVIAIGLALHIAAWFLFPPERAHIAADPALLANLYVSSAATTFCIIALVVGYAFTVADRARAEADSLLINILPEAIAERLKGEPHREGRRQRGRGLGAVQRSGRLHRSWPIGSARRAPSLCSTTSSPSSTGWRRRMAWRRSRPSATAIWRSPASAARKPTTCRGSRAWRCCCPIWWRGCPRRMASI